MMMDQRSLHIHTPHPYPHSVAHTYVHTLTVLSVCVIIIHHHMDVQRVGCAVSSSFMVMLYVSHSHHHRIVTCVTHVLVWFCYSLIRGDHHTEI